MSRSNVHKDGMNIDGMLAQLTDREVDKLLDGGYPVQGQDFEALVAAIETLRSSQSGPGPQAGPELAAVLSHGLPADGSAPPEWAIPPEPEIAVSRLSWRTRLTTRTARALTVLSVLFGTLTGKLVIGAAVAAASVSGIHAAGVVDVPGLPDRPLRMQEVREQDRAPEPDDAEVGNTAPSEAEQGDVQDPRRAPAVDGADQSEPATEDKSQNAGKPVDQSSPDPEESTPGPGKSNAGSGKNAEAHANAPGQSSNAKKPKKAKEPKDGEKANDGEKAEDGEEAEEEQ